MKYFTMDNTEGYSQEILDEANEQFPVWAEKEGLNLDNEAELKTAIDKFHNRVTIHG